MEMVVLETMGMGGCFRGSLGTFGTEGGCPFGAFLIGIEFGSGGSLQSVLWLGWRSFGTPPHPRRGIQEFFPRATPFCKTPF